MAKKNKETFAARADKLKLLYKKASFDKIEADELEVKMTELMQEQEQMRTELGLNNQETHTMPDGTVMPGASHQEQFGKGGKIMYPFGGGLTGLQNQFVQHQNTLSQMSNPQLNTPFGAFINPTAGTTADQAYSAAAEGLDPMNTLSGSEITALNIQADKTQPFGTKVGDIARTAGQSDYLPYAISGASNIGGNLLLASMAKRNQPQVGTALATPQRINLEPQAEQLRKDATTSRNIAMTQARNLGLNAGATMANVGAASTGIGRGLGANLTNLYGQQEQFNVGAANQFTLANQAAQNRANIYNAQLEEQNIQDRLGYVSGALGTLPKVMKDIRLDKADTEMRNVQEAYYKSIGGKNYATVGSIFKPGDGFKYRVKADKSLEIIGEE